MRSRAWMAAGALVVALLSGSQSAHALPGDDPITNLMPSNSATVPARASGIEVVYGCPVYTSIALLPNSAGRRQYGVRFSRSATAGADGRLANPVAAAGADMFADDLPEDRCRALMSGTGSPQTVPGVYYWQAHRLCVDCPSGYEVGPISRFTVTLTGPIGLSAPRRAYSTFPFIAVVPARSLPTGVTVVVQARRGSAWSVVGRGTVVGGSAKVPVRLRLGDRSLRASVAAGGGRTLRSVVRTVSVAPARTWPSGATWVGGWRGSQSSGSSPANVSWSVSDGGRTMRSARLRVTATCPSATAPGGFTIQILTVTAPRVRVAPDGTFVYVEAASSHAVLFHGKLVGLRATGSIRVSLGACVGSSRVLAKHR